VTEPAPIRTRPAALTRPRWRLGAAGAVSSRWFVSRVGVLVAAVALTAVSCAEALPTIAPAPTPTPIPIPIDTSESDEPVPTPEPTPTPNPGVSAEAIQIVTINDVVTGGIADDIFVSARQGIEAWVAAVNANGGLAGREVQLFPLDSGVVNHGSRMETLCEPGSSVLALVGSLSLLDGDGLEILQDPNCRIPDFPALANSPARRDSNLTFLTNPQRNLFYDVSTLQYIADQIRALDPQAVLRVSDMQVDQETFTVRNQRMKEAARNIGFSPGVSYSSSNGQSVENQARALLEFEIDTLVWTSDARRLADLLVAMGELSDEDPSLSVPRYVVCDEGCYDPAFVDAVGEYGDNVHLSIPHRLVTDNDIAEMREYLFWLNETNADAEPTSYSVHAWAAGRLFEQAVNLAVGTGSAEEDFDALSREGLIEAARQIENWNGRFLFGSFARPTSSLPGDCTIVVNLQDGDWVQVRPESELERFNCDPDNLTVLEATVDFGLEDEPALSATTSAQVSSTTETAETDETEAEEGAPVADEPATDVVDDLEETEEIPDE